jgi:hypothetical protein
MAPLDIKFNDTGRQAWITFHGSWNSPDPVGYKLSLVNFTSAGEPVDQRTSKTAAVDIFGNANDSVCPGDCFRPVAMAIDSQGRIFLSSDSTGEIYLVSRDSTASGTATSSESGSTSSSPSASTSSTSASTISGCNFLLLIIACFIFCHHLVDYKEFKLQSSEDKVDKHIALSHYSCPLLRLLKSYQVILISLYFEGLSNHGI